MLLVLLACTAGPNEETLIDELRVLAILAEPPEVGAGETAEVSTTIVDPLDEGYESLVWACLVSDTESSCPYTAVDSPTLSATLPTELSLPEETALPLAQVWALACVPGTCPLIDGVRTNPDDWAEELANPYDWMEDLPIVGTSLAYRTVLVSSRTERQPNPTLSTDSATSLSVEVGGSIELSFTVTGNLGEETKVYGYTTAGGFNTTEQRPDEAGGVVLTWFAPDEAGDAALYVIVNDSLGGTALWEASVTVE